MRGIETASLNEKCKKRDKNYKNVKKATKKLE